MHRHFLSKVSKLVLIFATVLLIIPLESLQAVSNGKLAHVHETSLKEVKVEGGTLKEPFYPNNKIINVETTERKIKLKLIPQSVNAKISVNNSNVNYRKPIEVSVKEKFETISIEVSSPRGDRTVYSLEITKKEEYDPTDVTLLQSGEGSIIQHYQLGFYPPSNMNGVQAYVLFYSKSSKIDVWNYVKDLNPEDIDKHLTSNSQGDFKDRMYKITNLGYADGYGNTFRSDQVDVITGLPLHVGMYRAYVATLGENGVLGMQEADKMIELDAFPENVSVIGEGNNIENYAVSFNKAEDDRITHYFLFYSHKGLTQLLLPSLEGKSLEDLIELEREKKGKLVEAKSIENSPIGFSNGQLSFEGNPLDENLYYVYVLAVSSDKLFGMSKSLKMINTNTLPEPLTSIGDGQGTIIPAGGSTSNVETYFEAIRLATKTERPKIAIFNSSRDSVDVAYDHFYLDDGPYKSLKEEFTVRGFEPIYIPLAVDTYEWIAYDPYFVNLVKSSHAVMLQGGDQFKHARSLLKDDGSPTPLLEAIYYVHENGGAIASTSAGAHVMSSPMFGVGNSVESLILNNTENKQINDIPIAGFLNPTIDGNSVITPGIHLMKHGLIDTHFDMRGRLGRLLVAMRDTGQTHAIGLDEGTAIQVTGDTGTVVGVNGVYIIDSSEAHFNEKGASSGFEVENVTVHYLTEGDQYNFITKEIVPSSKKELVVHKNGTLYESSNIFSGNYETTKSLQSFANSGEQVQVNNIGSGVEFEIRWIASEDTKLYASENNYSTRDLREYKKSAVVNVGLSVTVTDVRSPVGVKTVKTYSYNDTFFIEFTGPIDATTVSTDTVNIGTFSHVAWSPDSLSSSNEIEVRATESFPIGHEITIQGITDIYGNILPTQTWRKVGGINTNWELLN